MRCRGRVDGQRPRIADIRDMVEQLQQIDEGLSSLESSFSSNPTSPP